MTTPNAVTCKYSEYAIRVKGTYHRDELYCKIKDTFADGHCESCEFYSKEKKE